MMHVPQIDPLDLIDSFYDSAEEIGRFSPVDPRDIPQSIRNLLNHHQHMTVTVERFHGCPVAVQILQSTTIGNSYSREIVLRRTNDNRVVQFGIVRLDLSQVSAKVRREVLAGESPLGRILIENRVLRRVKLLSLYRVTPGPTLARLFGLGQGEFCYGRTAVIYCDSVPAIELLEVVPNANLIAKLPS